MGYRTTAEIMRDIRTLLRNEPGLSIRQIALRIGAQWSTAANALAHMRALALVTELPASSKRGERRFRLS